MYDPHHGRGGQRRYLQLEDALYKIYCLAKCDNAVRLNLKLITWHPDTKDYYNDRGLSENAIWSDLGQVELYRPDQHCGLVITTAPHQYAASPASITPVQFVKRIDGWAKNQQKTVGSSSLRSDWQSLYYHMTLPAMEPVEALNH